MFTLPAGLGPDLGKPHGEYVLVLFLAETTCFGLVKSARPPYDSGMRFRVLLAIAVLVVGLGQLSVAAPVFFDDFNSENGGGDSINYNSFANWTVTGYVDLVGEGTMFPWYAGNGILVDMDGTDDTYTYAGTLTSNITFGPGWYIVEFDYGNTSQGEANTLNISLGSWSTSLNTGSANLSPLQHYSAQLWNADPNAQLIISQAGTSDWTGSILDNVSVSSTVPEPATAALLGLGLISLAAFGRRNYRRNN